jgi:hypothetical protein
MYGNDRCSICNHPSDEILDGIAPDGLCSVCRKAVYAAREVGLESFLRSDHSNHDVSRIADLSGVPRALCKTCKREVFYVDVKQPPRGGNGPPVDGPIPEFRTFTMPNVKRPFPRLDVRRLFGRS